MHTIAKRTSAKLAVLTAAAVLSPATPAAAMPPPNPQFGCSVTGVLSPDETTIDFVVRGDGIAPGAVETTVECHLRFADGSTEVVSQTGPGPVVVALEMLRGKPFGPYSFCGTGTATYPDGTTQSGLACP